MGLGDDRRAALAAQGLAEREVYHLTALENVRSIIANGLQAHATMHSRPYVDISYPDAQAARARHLVPVQRGHSRPLHEMVPFFYTWSTPMAYRRAVGRSASDRLSLAWLVCSLGDLCADDFDVAFTSGNAAVESPGFGYDVTLLNTFVPWGAFEGPKWTTSRTLKHQRQAEFLVAPAVPSALIRRIEVMTSTAFASLQRGLDEDKRSIVSVCPEHFFHADASDYEFLNTMLWSPDHYGYWPTRPFSRSLNYVESLVQRPLPRDAYVEPNWWTDPGTIQSAGWSGFDVTVDLQARVITFTPCR